MTSGKFLHCPKPQFPHFYRSNDGSSHRIDFRIKGGNPGEALIGVPGMWDVFNEGSLLTMPCEQGKREECKNESLHGDGAEKKEMGLVLPGGSWEWVSLGLF